MAREWKVTAVVTTYKRGWENINRAVTSIASQTVKVHEILLVDDNGIGTECGDITAWMAEQDVRIRYIRLEKNGGVANARNTAIREAKGNIIAFLDDDDEWYPDKTETLLKVFDEHPNAGIVFGTGLVIDDSTGETHPNWQYDTFNGNPSFEDMLKNDHVGSASAPFIRMDALRDVGGFLTKGQPAVEDYELWIRISRKYPVYGVKKHVFIKHMDSSEHISTDKRKTFLGFANIYRRYRKYYDRDLQAKRWITWNASRQAVKATDIRGVPYVLKWFGTVLKTAFRREHER